MCRSEVAPEAREPLARLLADIARALADESGVDPSAVSVGPVDFGPPAPPAGAQPSLFEAVK